MASAPTQLPSPSDPSTSGRHRRSGRRRSSVLIAVAALVAAGAGAWGIDRAVSGSSAGPGHVLAYLDSGSLAQADPNGTHAVPNRTIGFIGGGGLVPSLDGQALVSSAGDLVLLRHGKPVSHNTTLYAVLSQHNGLIDGEQPFADGSAYVVFDQNDAPNSNGRPDNPAIVTVEGGAYAALGPGTDYAGDPQQEAAWVANPAGPQPTGDQAWPDTAIEHRLPGGASSTLITARQLDTDLDRPASTPLAMYVSPDPAGNKLVVGATNTETSADIGAVIVTRAGALVAKLPTPLFGVVAWSPSGRYLLTSSMGHASITNATGAVVATISLPATAQLVDACAWSPNETQIACSAFGGRGQPIDAWVVINRPNQTAVSYLPSGTPLLWTGN